MDDFSDDGFEDIDANVLQELENNAIQFTQAPVAQKPGTPQPTIASQSSAYGYEFEADDLDYTVVIDELAQLPAVTAVGREKSVPAAPPPRPIPNVSAQQRWNQQGAPSVASRGPTPKPSQPYPLRPVAPPYVPPTSRPPPSQSQVIRPPPPPITQRYAARPSEAPQHSGGPGQSDILTALQSRLHGLETELTSAKGEIAIVRSKFDKAQANHDAEIARLKKQNTEQLAKQERLVEAAVAAERTAATELQFTRQDLKEELGRAKSRRIDAPLTPRKNNKSWGMGDGFDDVELMPSPSKGRIEKGKAVGPIALPLNDRTPTKGKRKRPVVDSPVNALETHSDDVAMLDDEAPAAGAGLPAAGALRPINALPFDFLRLVLDHSSMHGQPPTFELFSRFSFPSDPSQTFASIIFHKLPLLGNADDARQLLIDFCMMLLDMWSQCLREKYYSPIYYVASLVAFTLQLNTMDVAPQLVAYLVPVAQTTCFMLAVPRFSSTDGDLSNHPDSTVQQLNADIDIISTLSVLYLVALGCASTIPSLPAEDVVQQITGSAQTEFWKLMQMEFVLVMLSPKQQPLDFLGMLSLLCTSVQHDSIGPIPNLTPVSSGTANAAGGSASGSDQDYAKTVDAVAYAIVERVSVHLVDTPRWAGRGTARQCEVRLAVLRTLGAFARSPFGAQQMAAHESAIPRLVTVLCAVLDALYDMDIPEDMAATLASTDDAARETAPADVVDVGTAEDPSAAVPAERADADISTAGQAGGGGSVELSNDNTTAVEDTTPPAIPPLSELATPALLHRIIAQTMRLLHFLIADERTAALANIHGKLAATPGGAQRYLLTLARLNFAEEDLVLEAGVEGETVEMAHELLEMAVTPDEGEGVSEVFSL